MPCVNLSRESLYFIRCKRNREGFVAEDTCSCHFTRVSDHGTTMTTTYPLVVTRWRQNPRREIYTQFATGTRILNPHSLKHAGRILQSAIHSWSTRLSGFIAHVFHQMRSRRLNSAYSLERSSSPARDRTESPKCGGMCACRTWRDSPARGTRGPPTVNHRK